METVQNVTVADIAKGSLAAVRVFEKFGIDYCCGGKRPLTDVCRDKGLSADTVQAELDRAMTAAPAEQKYWTTAPLAELINHIVTTHHEYLKRELGALGERVAKIERVYSTRENGRDRVAGLSAVYQGLADELLMHLRKEEMILFPFIEAYERATVAGQPLPMPPFGTVANPIRMMEHEHDSAGEALRRLREITHDFEVPEWACVTYRATMQGLHEVESDTHLHIHLENNILFPRAVALEQ